MEFKKTTGNVALVFGASGISGWALMRECLNYPSTKVFMRVIGLCKRPLAKEIARLPEDPRLEMHTGLDLTNTELALRRLAVIADVAAVTHVYFVTYTGHGTTPENLVDVNSVIVDNALKAVNVLCPNISFVSLQTGGKGYGMVRHGWPPAPWKETLPRMLEPYASKIFYYTQHDVVARHAAASSWEWLEIRPSFLPGFVPQFNAMNVAQSLGLYLSFYRSAKGDRAICPFPGSQESWVALHTDSFKDVVARFHIHVSLHPEGTNGRALSVGDGEPVSWQMKWPLVCNYFGLEGVGPQERATDQAYGIEWLMAQKDSWPVWVAAHGLQPSAMDDVQWDILATTLATPIRIDFDLMASREIGLVRHRSLGKATL
ncbi:Short chain dehydrogenase sirR [Colletotrichum aenigma]|uniref:Short chain dehydrogenase sirR n=1 Tax=Colletotrichum aenigma TaxID=1215731 RepID=UPI001872E69A|nr:Short chain dehydrogenase sirR [Colletotrichum aenigma]KAF5502419.1 Short chain dehydrogenase sirR [Colletotrichum aenigma]